ncbi:hypothetical protein HMPREF0511_1126 [Limosilactobacillus fermentum ATCC 14931]|nr:hypothetical protein HMPREF0511_1126 [Limosilactobacillus fermentum ATCC 14931]
MFKFSVNRRTDLAHGLPVGWVALLNNVLPTTGLVAKYGQRTVPGHQPSP